MTCECVSAGILVPFGKGYVPHTYDDLPAILPAETEGGGGMAAPTEATMAPAPASEATTLDTLRIWLGGFGEELWSGIQAGRNAAMSLDLAPWLLSAAIGLLLLILLISRRRGRATMIALIDPVITNVRARPTYKPRR